MSDLNAYLAQKRAALTALRERAGDTNPVIPRSVIVTAEGRSGVRRIRLRNFQLVSDSLPDFAGYDLGPSSPELLLAALGSCLTHSYLIRAADLGIPLDSLEVEINTAQDPRAGLVGKHHPLFPDGVSYTVRIASPASHADTERLREAVEQACPVLNFLQSPHAISGRVERHGTSDQRESPA